MALMSDDGQANLQTENLLRTFRECFDAQERESAVRELRTVRDPTVVRELGEALRTESEPSVSTLIIDYLEQIGNEQAIAYLAEAARQNGERLVRTKAISALGQTGHKSSVATLASISGSDQDPYIRAAAARALGQIGEASAIPYLETTLASENEPDVRSAIVRALARTSDDSVVPILGRVVEREHNTDVRIDAASGLGRLGSADAALHLVRNYTSDAPPDLGRSIEEALLGLPSSISIPPLTRSLLETDDAQSRFASILARIPEWELKISSVYYPHLHSGGEMW